MKINIHTYTQENDQKFIITVEFSILNATFRALNLITL